MSRADGNRVVLVTGASSGIGQACAAHLASRGYRVFGAARRCPLELREQGISTLPMDVRDLASVEAGINRVIDTAGQIDVLINNAGYALAGAVEDLTPEDLAQQFDTNVYGMLRVCKAALPRMRERRNGLIINISSLAARVGIPFQGAYSASKSALEALSEAMSVEVRPFGVRVVLIQPGDHRTPGTENRQWAPAARSNPLYRNRAESSIEVMAASERNGRDPSGIARVVERVISCRRPRLRYLVANPTERFLSAVHRCISGRAFEKILTRTFDPPDGSLPHDDTSST